MADADEAKIAGSHVVELSGFFRAHDQWLFGHACVRANGDRELAADLVQDTFEAAARVWPALREHDTGRQRAWLLATGRQDHRTTTEIAADLGLAEGTVHAHLHAARAKLTAGLRPFYPFDHDDHDDHDGHDDQHDSGRGSAS